MKVNHIGVIGVGYWGKKHVEELLNIGVRVTVSDLNQSNLKICKDKFGCEGTTNYLNILKNPDIQAVVISTPNDTHYPICKDALQHGKHVLLEKPMTTIHRHAIELVDLAKKQNLILGVGHIFRFNNAINKMKVFLNQNYFGDVYIVKLTWTNHEPVWNRDIIFDLAPHPFDIIHFLFGKNPNEISCIGEAYRKESGEEAAFVNAKIDKILINLEMSWLTPEKVRRLVLVGSEKAAFVDCLSQQIKVHDFKTKEETTINQIQPNNTIQDELRHFINRIQNNEMVSFADGFVGSEIVKVLEITKKSLTEKKTLQVV